jgi:acetylornithine/N-succinyldiaminopimelate aminotransferase
MTNATHPFDALMDITARPPTVFVRGEGAYLWDDAGKRYLDFMQGWAVQLPRSLPAGRGRCACGTGESAADAEPGVLQ